MDGQIREGWYNHPQLGLIKVFTDKYGSWVYQCYMKSGARPCQKKNLWTVGLGLYAKKLQ